MDSAVMILIRTSEAKAAERVKLCLSAAWPHEGAQVEAKKLDELVAADFDALSHIFGVEMTARVLGRDVVQA
jgi:hypothetical protein